MLDSHYSLGVIETCPMYCKVSCSFMLFHFYSFFSSVAAWQQSSLWLTVFWFEHCSDSAWYHFVAERCSKGLKSLYTRFGIPINLIQFGRLNFASAISICRLKRLCNTIYNYIYIDSKKRSIPLCRSSLMHLVRASRRWLGVASHQHDRTQNDSGWLRMTQLPVRVPLLSWHCVSRPHYTILHHTTPSTTPLAP